MESGKKLALHPALATTICRPVFRKMPFTTTVAQAAVEQDGPQAVKEAGTEVIPADVQAALMEEVQKLQLAAECTELRQGNKWHRGSECLYNPETKELTVRCIPQAHNK